MTPKRMLAVAIEEAQRGLNEGGLPIGSALFSPDGHVVARGRNMRVQSNDPTAHAETVCIKNAGRRRDWQKLTLVSTLSPCIMCTGTTLLYKIPRVIVGENINYLGAEALFAQYDVELTVLNDPTCIALMQTFITTHPDLWYEDIGE